MILPFLILSFLFSGCLAVTPESIAGEKERGTIATLLVTPIKRRELAIGKIISLSILATLAAYPHSWERFCLSRKSSGCRAGTPRAH
jgi:ABC-type Na+ efflux pump permease subunit